MTCEKFKYNSIDLSSEEFIRLSEALERDLERYPEKAERWEYDLVRRLKIFGEKRHEHICSFCNKPFKEGYISSTINYCLSCYNKKE